MQQLIDWQLLVNDKAIVDLKDIYCEFLDDTIILNEEEAQNKIELAKNRYTRTTNEYTMEIDFLNNICHFIFDNQKECSFSIDGSIKKEDNIVTIIYSYDEEIKKIIITLKGEN